MRHLDTFIFEEMIEQYARANPPPDPEDQSVGSQMESGLIESYLTELKALRLRTSLQEVRIVQLNRELDKLMIQKSDLERDFRELLEAVKMMKGEPKNDQA